MSSLINDLNSIYEIKQQIKEVAYIESDIFAEYPAYIAEAIQSGGATGTTTITGNGTYNVATYQYAYVDVPQQEVPVVPPGYTYVDGYTAIIANGEYDVATYAYAYIDVPAPEGWVLPTGTAFITTNGEFDIHLYESAYVTVPQDGIDWDEVASYGYIVPAGTTTIENNGTYNIGQYAYVSVNVSGGGITPSGTYNITNNGTYDISSYQNVNVNVPSSGQTIAQKNAAWQTKWAPALSTMAAGLYAQDPTYGEPQISDPSGWCVQTAIDGNAAMSELIAMDCLWIEIYGDESILHTQYVQIFTQMGLTLDVDGHLVSTDDDKILPFDADEAIVTNITGLYGMGSMGGKKISSLNGGIENAKWYYYGTVFNGTGFDYAYIGQFDYVVDQAAMLQQMQNDGVTFINGIPAVDQNTLLYYLESFELDGIVIPNGTYNITNNGTYDISEYAYTYVNVPQGGGLPTTEFSGAYDYINSSVGGFKCYRLRGEAGADIANIFTEDWWTYALPSSGYMINDPAFNDPTHKIYVMNDDVKNECTWQNIDFDYQNLPDWNTSHLAKESYDYYKGVVTFIPEYNQVSYEVVPYGMNKRYNKFSYTGLCSYGTSWQQQNTLFNKGAYMGLKKDSNVINNENQAYWLTSQKVTYSGNADIWDGSYISSFFGSSWNAVIDKDGYIRDIVSKVGDTNAYQAKWGSDDTVTTTSNAISISGYITNQNYTNYINTPNNLYINYDTIPSYVSNQPYLFKYGFEPGFSSDINTSGITSYSTSKQVTLSITSSVSDTSFSDIVNNYPEFTFEYTLTIPKRFFMDPENNPATLDYTFTDSVEPTPSGSDTITAVQTQISQTWWTSDRKTATYDNGYYVTSVTKSNKTGQYMTGYKVNEVNITGATSGQQNLIPVIDNVLYFDDSISTATGTFNLTDRTDQNGVTFINADDVTTTSTWTMEIKVPEDALDTESANYKTCTITVTKS